MTFLRSFAVLTAICLCVGFAYFVGHGLALHEPRPMIYGVGLLLAGAAMLWFMAKRDQEKATGDRR
jgi:membrane protein DedA with SNARE-associated domain